MIGGLLILFVLLVVLVAYGLHSGTFNRED